MIKIEDGVSFADRAETYYRKKPEIEKRIEEFRRLYRSLAEYCSHFFDRSSISSLSARFEGSNVDYKKLSTSDSNPESGIEDPELESHMKRESANGVSMSLNLIAKGRTSSFDRRISCVDRLSDLIEENWIHTNELVRRLENKREANKELRDSRVEKLVRENKMLQEEHSKLVSENLALQMRIRNRLRENEDTMFCSRCSKGKKRRRRFHLSRLKILFLSAFCRGIKRSQ
uniref:NAB domain-containing protein n=1 Tax=Ananas comosus var. bracteatus TaxID=296719 RepID=A0A6V7Q0U9_ANACO|nr:unnamed protein product [Ananas comosus var. bracteatus]